MRSCLPAPFREAHCRPTDEWKPRRTCPGPPPPHFPTFVAPSPLAGLAQIYQYVGGELSMQPANPMPVISEYYTPVTRGQAYWVSATNVNNKYFAPFQITLPDPSGISFGISGGQMTF